MGDGSDRSASRSRPGLVPCARCQRHARVDELRCPFCDAELSPEARSHAYRQQVGRFSLAIAVSLALADCAGHPLPSGPSPSPSSPSEDRRDAQDASNTADARMTDALDAAAEAMTYSPKPPMHSIYTGVAYRCDRIHQHVDFELHTTTILPQDRKVIEVIAQVLKDRSRNVRTIEVTGHVHWAEGKSKGWLAAARAAKVRSALLKLGVEPARVRVGKAEDPADAGSPPAAVTIESVEFDDPHCAG